MALQLSVQLLRFFHVFYAWPYATTQTLGLCLTTLRGRIFQHLPTVVYGRMVFKSVKLTKTKVNLLHPCSCFVALSSTMLYYLYFSRNWTGIKHPIKAVCGQDLWVGHRSTQIASIFDGLKSCRSLRVRLDRTQLMLDASEKMHKRATDSHSFHFKSQKHTKTQ